MADIKNIANTFDLSIKDFATLTGYSRQALHQIVKGDNGVCTPRLKSTIELLKFTSEQMHEEDVAQARIKKNQRDKAINELADYLGIPNDSKYKIENYDLE